MRNLKELPSESSSATAASVARHCFLSYTSSMRAVIFFLLFIAVPVFAQQMTLKELESVVLSENPKIKAMEQEVKMASSKISSSSALDDPRLKLGVNNVPVNNFSMKDEDMTSKEIGISQMFPLGGKLGLKEDIARLELKRSQERLKKEKLEVLQMLRMNVYELLYSRSAVVILEETKEQVKLLVESELAANKAGTGSLSGVLKANMELAMLEEEIINLKQKEQEILQNIRYLAGRPVTISETGLPEPVFTALDNDEIQKIVLQSNPELLMVAADIDISAKERDMKKKEYYPDIELGVSYMQRDRGPMGERPDMVSAMVSFNIPLWYSKKNVPMIEEMQNKNSMMNSLYNEKKNELVSRAAAVISVLKKWESLYKLYNEQLIPQAQLVIETSLARYRTGKGEFMQVIDTVRMLFKYRKEVLMAKKEYLAGIVDLNRLMAIERYTNK